MSKAIITSVVGNRPDSLRARTAPMYDAETAPGRPVVARVRAFSVDMLQSTYHANTTYVCLLPIIYILCA